MRIISRLFVGEHASKSVIADDKGLYDLLQSLHECRYLPGLATTVGLDQGYRHRFGLMGRHDFHRQAFVDVGVTALGRASVSDNIGGAVAALLGSTR
jgi:hypothetical protein